MEKKRGFAALSPEKRAAISSLGGKAAHAKGTGHQFTSEEARVAGKKGGVAPHVSRGGKKKQPLNPDQANLPVVDGKVIVPIETPGIERDENGLPMRLYPESIQAKA